MSDYTKTTDFSAKDSLPQGDPGKVIKGSEHDTEFNNIETAIATKANKVVSGTANNIATLTAAGDIQDGGQPISQIAMVGEVRMYGGDSAPTGWLLCNGSAISRTTYNRLYSVIGTKFGSGDGSTTFNLPDIRGRVVVGAGSGNGLTSRSLGDTGGEEEVTLTIDEMPEHDHGGETGGHTHTNSVSTDGSHNHGGSTSTNGNHRHSTNTYTTSTGDQRPATSTGSGSLRYTDYAGNHSHTISSDGDHSHTVTIDSATDTISAEGGGQAHNNMQPFVVLNYIIKY